MASLDTHLLGKIVSSNLHFALDLYKLCHGNSNAFISPISIALALGMTHAASDANTAEEIRNALHLTSFTSHEKINEAFKGIMDTLQNKGDHVVIRTANRMYVHHDVPLHQTLQDTTKHSFKAEIGVVDFFNDSEKTRKEINSWVEESTNKKIKDLLAPGILTHATRLVLANAIYFKGKWARQFQSEETGVEEFHTAPGRTVKVNMMVQKAKFGYAEMEDLKCKVLEMPYVGKMSMVFVLPDSIDGLKDLEASITPDNLQKLFVGLPREEVTVKMPKFKLEETYNLKEMMARLGVHDLFTPEKADLSKITGSKNDLFVSAAIHKSFVEVNESGTEAAAATSLMMECAMFVMPVKEFKFIADHPFLLFIVDGSAGGLVVFMGSLKNPPTTA